MKRIHRLSLAAACVGAAASAPAAHACSKPLIPAFWDGAHLIATATPDTVLAGHGSGWFRLDPNRRARREDRGIHGQVVRVERVAGPDAAALPAGVDRAVLVPWGYDESCSVTRYQGSARWVEPGERGLFWAVLRRRDRWVDGLPTFDVGDAHALPYTPRKYAVIEDSLMSVDQAFEVIRRLPPVGDYERDAEAAYRPLLAWARANPRLARLFPAAGMVRGARHLLRYARIRRIEPPLAGTYRFRVTVDGGAPRTFYARTRSTAWSEWDPEWSPGAESPAPDEPIAGYMVMLAAAAVADSLPVVCDRSRFMDRESSFSVAAVPERRAGGVRVWRGRVELSLAARALPGDSVLLAVERAEFERRLGRERRPPPMEQRMHAPARFLLRPDGSAAVEQTMVLHDGRTVTITGERLSRVTIPHPGVMRNCGQ